MKESYKHIAARVFEIEEAGLARVRGKLSNSMDESIDLIMQSRGRVVVCGMGKSGHIAKKISATLASTGTPAVFLHPAEAFHGDLGIVNTDDVFIAISYSGETVEVLKLLPFLEDNGNDLIAMTGNIESSLAMHSTTCLDIGVNQEACPYDLAPTASTTSALAMGDALAVCLMKARDFKPDNFARFHPGGSLGKRLLGKVQDYMVPAVVCGPNALFEEVLSLISSSKMGSILVVENKSLLGVITDGDVRRSINDNSVEQIVNMTASQLMTTEPLRVDATERCGIADKVMKDGGVNGLVIQSDGDFFIYHNLNRPLA